MCVCVRRHPLARYSQPNQRVHTADVCCERVRGTQGEQPAVYVHTLDTLSEKVQLFDVADVEVATLSLSRDGRRLLTVAREPDLTLIVWDVASGQQLASAVVEAEVDTAAFNPACDDELLLAGPDGVHVWTLHRHVHQSHCSLSPRRMQLQGWAPLSAAWLPGARLLVGADDGSVLLADARTGQLMEVQPEQPQWATLSAAVCALAVHRHHVLAATVDGTLRLLSLPNANPSTTDPAAEPNTALTVLWQHLLAEEEAPIEVTALCYAPSYSRVALATSDAALYVLTLAPDAAPHAPRAEVQCVAEYHCGAVTALVALPDGEHFAACGDDGVLRVWSAEQRAVAFHRQLSAPLTALAVSANASLLALGSAEGVVRLFALPAHGAQEPVLVWRGRLHDAPVSHLAFSPSGDMLASCAGQAGEGALWFVATGAPLPSSTAPHALGCTHQLAAHHVTCMVWAAASASAPDGVLLMATHSAEMLWLQPPPLSVQPSGPQCELPARAVPMRRLRLEVRPCLLHPMPIPSRLFLFLCLFQEARTTKRRKQAETLDVAILWWGLQSALDCVCVEPAEAEDGVLAVLALGRDKKLKRLTLPADVAAWTGPAGRPHGAASETDVLLKTGTALHLHHDCVLLAAADGSVTVRKPGDWKAGSALAHQQLHDSYLGGTAAAAMGTGMSPWVVTAGVEGVVFVCRVEGLHSTAPSPSTLPAALDSATLTDVADDFDLPEEPLLATVLTAAAAAAAAAVAASAEEAAAGSGNGGGSEAMMMMAAGADGTRATVKALRERFQALQAQNAAATSLEQLTFSEMIVDAELKTQLEAAAAVQVQEVRQQIHRSDTTVALLSDRIASECFSAMQEPGQCLRCMGGHSELNNFPVRTDGRGDRRKAVVSFLRRVEQMEEAAAPAPTVDTEAAVEEEAAGGGGDDVADDEQQAVVQKTAAEQLLYDPLAVHGLLKQRTQMTLLDMVLHVCAPHPALSVRVCPSL